MARYFFMILTLCLSQLWSSEGVASDTSINVPRPMAMGLNVVKYSSSNIDKTDFKLSQERFTLKAPVYRFDIDNWLLIPQFELQKVNFSLSHPTERPDAPDLYTLKFPITLAEKDSGKWQRIFTLTPSVHSDLESMDKDAYSLMGLALWRYKFDDNKSILFGGGINRLFGEYKPVPMVSYAYQPNAECRNVLFSGFSYHQSRNSAIRQMDEFCVNWSKGR